MRRRTYVCFNGDPDEQCSYVSYGGYFDARESGWPLHRHDDHHPNKWAQWAHGPAEKCLRLKVKA